MSRLFYIGAVVSIALLAAPLPAQKSAPNPQATVEHVLVRGSGDAMEVEIQTSASPVSPNTQALTGPDRIVVDFPGMLPSAELRALKVNRGALKSIRSGLFFNNPPITRIVLDLTGPQSYQISTIQNAIVVKLAPSGAPGNEVASAPMVGGVRLRDASLSSSPSVPTARLSTASISAGNVHTAVVPRIPALNANVASAQMETVPVAAAPPTESVKPALNVTYENGMLRIRAEKATLAQVLFEVHQQTQAEIAIPAGAEQEQVISDLGPAPARDVLSALLNGSSYNFVFVGNELALERVILTRRDSSIF
jgi:hypothetical protein